MIQSRVGDLETALGILSAMITPAVLILASGSLIMTTSTRLIRAVDRVREILGALEEMPFSSDDPAAVDKQNHALDQLDRVAARARLLQRALTQLYLGLAAFLGTSVAIGVIELARIRMPWLPLTLGFIGAALLFAASVMLIIESRIALASTFAEMDYAHRVTAHRAPERRKRERRWNPFGV